MSLSLNERTSLIKLAVAMFNVAPGATYLAEITGLYEANGRSLSNVAAILSNTPAYKAMNPVFQTAAEFATAFLTPLGLQASGEANDYIVAKFNAYGTGVVNKGQISLDASVALANYTGTDTSLLAAKATLDNKTAVATYYSVDKQIASTDLAALKAVLVGVTADVATVATGKAAVDGTATAATVTTFTLTAGVDAGAAFTGGAGNDIFNASVTATSATLGGLDSIDGGAGTDTLNIADTAVAAGAYFNLPAGMTVKNVETLNITTNGAVAASAGVDADFSALAGLNALNVVAAGTANSKIKASATTDVKLTVAGTATSTTTGGKSVAIVGGGTSTVGDFAGATGTTLTSVSLSNVGSAGGVTSTLTGNGIASVTLSDSQVATGVANTVTVTNATVGHALTINAAGTGYDAATTPVKVSTVVTDTAATSLTVNTTAKSAIDASGSTLVKTVTLTGAGALNLVAMGAAATSIDGSAATGALTLNTLNITAVTVQTGAGNDTFTLSATTKATVDTGAGNDSVTLAGILAAGSTITFGAGNDKILGTAKVAVSTSTLVTVIDGGDGIDTVSAGLINNGNAAQFKNFEVIGLEGSTTLDLALMTGSVITGLELVSGGGTYTNATLAQSLIANTNTTGTTSIAFTGATGGADVYAINFGATSTGTAAVPTAINAGTLTLAGIEVFNVKSAATAGVSANALTFTAAQAQQIIITGDQALTVGFTGTNGTIVSTVGGISTIDGSAATGKLAINVTNVTAAAAGITVKGGFAVDTLTTAAFATSLTGNAGNDSFVVTGTTVGSGNSATPIVTTITDFTKGDTITLVNASGATSFTTTKVDVSAAITLAAALDLAGSTGTTANTADVSYFQYGGNTYVVQDNTFNASKALATGDVVVKLIGLLDLSTAAVATGTGADVLSWA